MTTTVDKSHAELNPYTSPLDPGRLVPRQPSTLVAASVVVTLAALAMVATLPGRTQGLGLVTEGLLRDLDLGKPYFARLNLVATLIGAAFCWPCGWLLDRLGMRITGAVVLFLLAVSTFGIATTHSLAMLWVWITLTRGLGQSMLSVVSITLVGKGSIGPRQPIAMAAYSVLVSIFFIAAFSGMGLTIPAFGWRVAWQALAWSVVGIGVLFAILVKEPVADSDPLAVQSEAYDSATLGQAFRSPAFWIFVVTSSLYAMVTSGLSLFNQSILAERQFDAQVFYQLLTITTFSGMLSNLLAGLLATRISYGKLMGGAMTIYTLALLAFPLVSTLWQVYLYGVAMGCCGGVVTVVFFGVWSSAFGPTNLGKIQGFAQGATVFASAVGPLVFAECLAYFGSYSPVFWALAPIVGLLAIASFCIPTPRARIGMRATL